MFNFDIIYVVIMMQTLPDTYIPMFKWFIVGSSFFVCFLVDGIQLSFGILLVDLVESQADRASTAVLGALVNASIHIVGPLAGFLTDKYGCRSVAILGSVLCFLGFLSSAFVPDFLYLYFTYGIIGGCGLGLMFLPANVIVVKHFTKHRTFAASIVACGSGVGTFAFNEIFNTSIKLYGWRGSMFLIAGISLHGIACALLFVMPNGNSSKPCEKSKGDNNITRTEYEQYQPLEINNSSIQPCIEVKADILLETVSDPSVKGSCEELFSLSLFKNPKFVAFIGSTFAVGLAFTIPFHLIPDQAMETGMSKSEAAWLASTMGISNAAGRLVIGIIGDRELVKREQLLKILLLIAGVATCLSPLQNTFATKMIYSCVFGASIGGYVGLIPVVLADVFGQKLISKSFGMFMFTVGISAMLATPIGGVIFDKTGSYDIVFVIAGCEIIVASCLIMLPEYCFKLNKK